MSELRGLPILIGVTGHRDLRPQDEPAITLALSGILERFQRNYASTPILLLTPLATGADRLAARVALSLGIPFRVPFPMEPNEYRKDFNADEAAEFDRLVSASEATYTLPFVRDNGPGNVGEPERRALQYALVGRHLARLAHVLIAIWNGKVGDSVGGTGRTVEYRLYGASQGLEPAAPLLEAPLTGAVYHIAAARLSDPAVDWPIGTIIVKTRTADVRESDDPFRVLYEKIERLNADYRKHSPPGSAPATLAGLRTIAEELANRFQARYLLALRSVFVATTAAAIFLSLADGESRPAGLALAYCVLIGLAYATYRRTVGWKDRAVEYRALEMGLTVQRLWTLVGLPESVADSYAHIVRSELDWIRDAIRTASYLDDADPEPSRGVPAVYEFVTAQCAFFANGSERDERRYRTFERLKATAFFTSLGLLTPALALLALDRKLADSVAAALPSARTADPGELCIHGIAIATIMTAAFHEYAVRRAFRAQARSYTGIQQIYDRAVHVLDSVRNATFADRLATTRDVIRMVGREALSENGEWLLMHRTLPVDFLHV